MTKKVLLILGAAIALAIFTYNSPLNTPVTPKAEEKSLTDQERWDKGEFTDEELAEIKAEEAREDAAKEEFFDQLDSGKKPDLQEIYN